jgi:hypothetical protein
MDKCMDGQLAQYLFIRHLKYLFSYRLNLDDLIFF